MNQIRGPHIFIHSCVDLQRDIATRLMKYECNDNVSYENGNKNTTGIQKGQKLMGNKKKKELG